MECILVWHDACKPFEVPSVTDSFHLHRSQPVTAAPYVATSSTTIGCVTVPSCGAFTRSRVDSYLAFCCMPEGKPLCYNPVRLHPRYCVAG
ncbi:hypothetical protein Pla175_17800 [Pirellulimonas nuda]|uniref:Uncharacterized protein n=1 Tax=Pirellulimonas nuda TaxID=2528009 RepID=A0A518DA99_9BACT|nr:hypothetical protein Pla175_17800 [Pirellulimonas nuda]